MHDRVDERQMRKRLREIAEVTPALRVDLLRVEVEWAGQRQQLLAELAARFSSPISTSADTARRSRW